MAQLVDDACPIESRAAIVGDMLRLKDCCVNKFFAQPVLHCIRQEGGEAAITNGSSIMSDLEVAMRVKTSNLEVELNFSRAATSRSILHGKSHNISSLVAKHTTSEIKLAQRRKMIKFNRDGKSNQRTDPGKFG